MNLKTKRVQRDDGNNDYKIITDQGDVYYLKREGNGFTCNGKHGSIKFIKKLIETGEIPGSRGRIAEDDTHVRIAEDDGVAVRIAEDETDGSNGTWECMHPCAIITLLWGSAGGYAMKADIRHTLDAYGWLTPDGKPDYRRAMAERRRFSVESSQMRTEVYQ